MTEIPASYAVAPALYLASRSPRRTDLLRLLGVSFAVVDVDVDETMRAGELPAAYVLRVALEKARAGSRATRAARPVLAADTTVVCDDEILGKPADEADAHRMLRKLAGRWHAVFTGVVLHGAAPRRICVETRVLFRALSAREITRYWQSGESAGKAGAYAIQGLGGAFVERIDGSYSNVVGLPLVETVALLDAERIYYRLT